jgi:hypothetical protein
MHDDETYLVNPSLSFFASNRFKLLLFNSSKKRKKERKKERKKKRKKERKKDEKEALKVLHLKAPSYFDNTENVFNKVECDLLTEK